MIEPVSNDPFDDRADRVPADPHQPGDRHFGHLLRKPRDHVLEVTGVTRARPRPRNRLRSDAAVRAPHASQLTLNPALAGTQIKMAPALHTSAVHMPGELPTTRAHPASTSEPDGHDHPHRAEADIDHRRARQAQKPVECSRDAHVALLAGRLTFDSQQPAPQGGGASPRSAQPPKKTSTPKPPAHTRVNPPESPPKRPETRF